MYKNGVFEACFKSEVELSGEGEITLRVPIKKLNNVLKTLSIYGEGITLKEVMVPRLESWRPSIDPSSALIALIKSLIGKNVKIQLSTGTISGTLLGIEENLEVSTQNYASKIKGIVVFTDNKVEAYPLTNVKAIYLPDEERRILSDYFTAKEEALYIKIVLSGNGRKKVIIKYVDLGTSWTPSYRLYIKGEKSWIIGLAEIKNETSYNWKGVKLEFSTASPRFEEYPISRVPVRPTVVPRKKALETKVAKFIEEAAPAEIVESEVEAKEALSMALQSFVVRDVHLGKGESKLLPLFAREISAESFSTWDTYNDFALRKIKIKNITDVHIVAGNVTIYLDDVFLGSVRIDDIPINGEREIVIEKDRRLKVKKVQQLIKTTTGLIRQGVKRAYETRLIIENISDNTIKLRIHDRPPEGILKPEIHDATIPPDDFKDGAYIWNLKLKPREKIEIKLNYVYKE